MENEIPAEVQQLMERRGFTKRRGEGASASALAEAVGLHTSTVTSLLKHGRISRPQTADKVAEALGVSAGRLMSMIGRTGGELYVGPEASRLMTERERTALTEYILATTEDRKAVTGNVEHPAPIDSADDESAQDYTKVTSLFGSGRQLHGVEGTDEDDEEIASQDKPEGVPPRNTRDDD